MADDKKAISTNEFFDILRDEIAETKGVYLDKENPDANPTAEDLEKVREKLTNVVKNSIGMVSAKEKFNDMATVLSTALKQMAEAVNDKDSAFIQVAKDFVKRFEPLIELIEQWEKQTPFIEEELKKPEYGGKSFDEIEAEGMDPDGEIIPGSLFAMLLENSYAAMAEAEAKKQANTILTTVVSRTDKIEFPLDKINSTIWQLLQEDTGGQISLKAEKTGSNQQLSIYYAIDFEDLTTNGITITKQLLPFDKRAYIAVSALFNAGNNIITLTQIHYAMGNSKRPNAKQLQKIYDSLKKMTGARIYVDNTNEADTYNYPVFKYSGSLLPTEDIQAIVNGQLSDAAIHLFREPPLITFAKERKQVTTVTPALLDSPVSKTDANIAIDDYLIERIAKAKNGKGQSKILLTTLYENTNIITPNQRSRAPEKIKRYLDHYKKQGFIKAYKITADSIHVFFDDTQK